MHQSIIHVSCRQRKIRMCLFLLWTFSVLFDFLGQILTINTQPPFQLVWSSKSYEIPKSRKEIEPSIPDDVAWEKSQSWVGWFDFRLEIRRKNALFRAVSLWKGLITYSLISKSSDIEALSAPSSSKFKAWNAFSIALPSLHFEASDPRYSKWFHAYHWPFWNSGYVHVFDRPCQKKGQQRSLHFPCFSKIPNDPKSADVEKVFCQKVLSYAPYPS